MIVDVFTATVSLAFLNNIKKTWKDDKIEGEYIQPSLNPVMCIRITKEQ